MTIATIAQMRLRESWQHYQDELQRVIAPLTEEQLGVRLVPELRSLGEIAEHIIYARALWLTRVLGEDTTDLAPFQRWDAPGAPPRPAAEVVQGLDRTWQHIGACLARWTAADPYDPTPIPEAEVKRLQVIWGLMEHDLHHGGELSFILGAAGLPALDM